MKNLAPGTVVADVILNPPDTRFLREARERGDIALDGLGMLANLGAISIKLWTGLDADKTVMRQVLEKYL